MSRHFRIFSIDRICSKYNAEPDQFEFAVSRILETVSKIFFKTLFHSIPLLLIVLSSIQTAVADNVPPTVWWAANVHNNGSGPLGYYKSAVEACTAAVYSSSKNENSHSECKFTGGITQINTDAYYCSGTCTYTRFDPPPDYVEQWSGDSFGVTIRTFWCPNGYGQDGSPASAYSCVANGPNPDKDKGPPPCPNCASGNPINAANGNKFQAESDYVGIGPFPLRWSHFYSSFGNKPGNVMLIYNDPLNKGWSQFAVNPYQIPSSALMPTVVGEHTNVLIDRAWRSNLDRSIVTTVNNYQMTAMLMTAENTIQIFRLSSGVWIPDQDNLSIKLEQINDGAGHLSGWRLTNNKDEIEFYDASGKLIKIQNKAGLTQSMHYDAQGLLSQVTDSFGRSLQIAYDAQQRMSVLTDPNLATYQYSYDTFGNLSKVSYPDGHTRQYLYEDARYPSALTGIIDENGARFATWKYDDNGRGISSEHAGGVEKITVGYGTNAANVNDVAGVASTYTTQVILGVARPTGVADVCGNNCSRSRAYTYDSNSNLASSTDWNGIVTKYSYDLSRNLETSRVEASGTPQARTVMTTWHPTYRLPLSTSEPLLRTTYTYDGSGNVLTKTEQATTDANGASGFSATLTGSPRVWTYTYNNVGQVLTATGPRTDVTDVTTSTYDSSGNLSSVTNALGHVTSLTNYDANGRVGRITEPNGATTDMTYSPRGWLTSRVVTSGTTVESTSYDYDGVGQVKLVTLPDGSSVSYVYDDAHRLTQVSDSLGNSITYTLDLRGNRTQEQVKDPNGNLARQISRVYDSLNRLQQVTGAAQ